MEHGAFLNHDRLPPCFNQHCCGPRSISMKDRRAFFYSLFCLLASGSCRGNSLTVPLGRAIASVSVFPNPPSGQLRLGETGVVEAVGYDAYGSVTVGKSISFATSDAKIVRLDAGIDSRHKSAVAIGVGTAVISVIIDGVQGSTTLQILP
jgi:hypothetical protein